MPAFRFEALDAAGKATNGLLKPNRRRPPARSFAPRRWCRWPSPRSSRPAPARRAACTSVDASSTRPASRSGPGSRRPGRLRPAAGTGADGAGRRGRDARQRELVGTCAARSIPDRRSRVPGPTAAASSIDVLPRRGPPASERRPRRVASAWPTTSRRSGLKGAGTQKTRCTRARSGTRDVIVIFLVTTSCRRWRLFHHSNALAAHPDAGMRAISSFMATVACFLLAPDGGCRRRRAGAAQ